MRSSHFLATLVIVGLSIGLTACSGDSDAAKETTKTATQEPSATPTGEATKDKDSADTKGDGTSPEWAKPTSIAGEKLATIEGDGFTVDVYQVGTTVATKTGNLVDAETKLPLINVGDEIVFVNYVMTNTGTEPIQLSDLLVEVRAKYPDWKYSGIMGGVSDDSLYEEMGIVEYAVPPAGGGAPFIWEPGQSFSTAENFKYQAGSPIIFKVGLTPADENGRLIHDQRQETSVETTLK